MACSPVAVTYPTVRILSFLTLHLTNQAASRTLNVAQSLGTTASQYGFPDRRRIGMCTHSSSLRSQALRPHRAQCTRDLRCLGVPPAGVLPARQAYLYAVPLAGHVPHRQLYKCDMASPYPASSTV